jgi:hypothetical protein
LALILLKKFLKQHQEKNDNNNINNNNTDSDCIFPQLLLLEFVEPPAPEMLSLLDEHKQLLFPRLSAVTIVGDPQSRTNALHSYSTSPLEF